jgi:ribose transport system permease protein
VKKILGILGLFIAVCLWTTWQNGQFVSAFNLENLIRWTALFGFISIGVGFVIITRGIDLSIGAVIAFTGCLLPMFLTSPAFAGKIPIPAAIFLVLLISAAIGLKHGLLVTKLKIQPFVVTLCSLMFYRGLARFLANDQIQGFGSGFKELKFLAQGKPLSLPFPFLRWISDGNWHSYEWNFTTNEPVLDASGQTIPLPLFESIGIPTPMLMLIVVAALAILFLNYSIQGRYLLALGQNEQAARLSGVNTDRLIVATYVICSVLAGFTGILFALDLNSVQPSSHANFYELYAIAAAVLGGCSLRGGEGSIVGVIIGAALMRVLYNSINMQGIPPQLEFVIIGVVILAGVIADEAVKRYVAKRRAKREALAHRAA